ncbi:hypothetical protein B0I35DRAFT_427688 [Stachybotrys elegans]|uniref:Uncharacterized protein n=1 Tax=Stachybotrys elegans TaxID=80388 RepID=A0A8K0SSE1_9HYPO|nr:hypothetical protein B0I35DRAFT_427688 [Stachybotrys elegans]
MQPYKMLLNEDVASPGLAVPIRRWFRGTVLGVLVISARGTGALLCALYYKA